MKKVVLQKDNRTFAIYVRIVNNGFGDYYAKCSIWETVHPNNILFKNKYLANSEFWINRYSSVQSGIETILEDYLEKETRQLDQKRKIKEFKRIKQKEAMFP